VQLSILRENVNSPLSPTKKYSAKCNITTRISQAYTQNYATGGGELTLRPYII
jgi:hypothetical protein